ncbi:MAG TPA: hypothetical protein VK611_20935 [Acidimicrobiales bacterium]|nr:hypothetical protein [Acidimicrobiales bacterium]
MRKGRRLSIAAVGLVLLLGLPLATATATAAPSAACPPGQTPVTTAVRSRVTGKMVSVTICQGGSTTTGPTTPGDDGDGGGGGFDPDNYLVCNPWEQVNPGSEPWGKPEGASPDIKAYQCVQYINGNPQYGPYIPQWLEPGEVPLPSPQEVAGDLLADVRGELLDPALVSDPAAGTPSLIDVPTFVSVSNWQEGFTRESCDPTGAICVTLTAAPALTFDPGDGGAAVACEPGGTRFDPEGPSPREQADAEGACAHVYGLRTGVAGRPTAWEGEVTVTWSVSWAQTAGGGQTGVLADIPLAAALPREVEEVQSVIDG